MDRDLVELIEFDPKSALAVFSTPSGTQPFLDKIRTQIDAFTADVGTKAGRDSIRSFAMDVARSKVFLDTAGKAETAKAKELPAKIDAARKHVRDTLDAWRDEVRKPLTDWEAVEEARLARHRLLIEGLHMAAKPVDQTVEQMQSLLETVEEVEIGKDQCEEFIAEYALAKDLARKGLLAAIEQRKKQDADEAELAKLRKLQEEREALDREERLRKEGEARAQEKADAAAKKALADAAQREQDLKDQAAAAERRAKDEIARAKREAEEAAENERKAAEAREANKRHCAAINRAAVKALVDGGVPEEAAKLAVTLIAQKKVPAFVVNY